MITANKFYIKSSQVTYTYKKSPVANISNDKQSRHLKGQFTQFFTGPSATKLISQVLERRNRAFTRFLNTHLQISQVTTQVVQVSNKGLVSTHYIEVSIPGYSRNKKAS